MRLLLRFILFSIGILLLANAASCVFILWIFDDFCDTPLDPIVAPGGELAVVETIVDCGALGDETSRRATLVRRGWFGDEELGVLFRAADDRPAFQFTWLDATTLEACWWWGGDASYDLVYQLTTATSEATILYAGPCP